MVPESNRHLKRNTGYLKTLNSSNLVDFGTKLTGSGIKKKNKSSQISPISTGRALDFNGAKNIKIAWKLGGAANSEGREVTYTSIFLNKRLLIVSINKGKKLASVVLTPPPLSVETTLIFGKSICESPLSPAVHRT